MCRHGHDPVHAVTPAASCRDTPQRSLRRSQLLRLPSACGPRCRSLSRAPDRVLTTQLSRMARPGSATSSPAPQGLNPHDRGMGRAVSRIMTRARSTKIAAVTSPALNHECAPFPTAAPRLRFFVPLAPQPSRHSPLHLPPLRCALACMHVRARALWNSLSQSLAACCVLASRTVGAGYLD